MLSIKIKPMQKSDVDAVIAIEAKAYGEHHWSKESFYNELSNDLARYYSVYNQNDELILVDYKTDYTQDEGKDLVDKYKVQLEIYKKALEEALKIPVKETYIYSIYANKAINLEKR